jgi:hypothetical protein
MSTGAKKRIMKASLSNDVERSKCTDRAAGVRRVHGRHASWHEDQLQRAEHDQVGGPDGRTRSVALRCEFRHAPSVHQGTC